MPTPPIDPVLEGLARALDVLQQRHAVLTANLANVSTPGFRARDTDFGAALTRAFDRAAQAEPARAAMVLDDDAAAARADGTTVDRDLQMAKLADNAGRYRALTRVFGKRVAAMRLAIDGGK